eukprot:1150027-Pelagomonas_calceolata.AAC.1
MRTQGSPCSGQQGKPPPLPVAAPPPPPLLDHMFNGTLVVKIQLFKLVKGMLSVTSPTDTQKDGT